MKPPHWRRATPSWFDKLTMKATEATIVSMFRIQKQEQNGNLIQPGL